MGIETFIWHDHVSYLRKAKPDHPVCFFAPDKLRETLYRFQSGFPGLVTYAVKANATSDVLENLVGSGLQGFDVASPTEIKAARAICKKPVLHYNNPVRSKSEIAFAKDAGIKSFSVDSFSELAKLAEILPRSDVEISVRLKLNVKTAAYDFGSKFGATPEKCVALLEEVARLGFTPSLAFHPGTQCKDSNAWRIYIEAAAEIADRAMVRISRLNVGGGFPSHRKGAAPDIEKIFETISKVTRKAFRNEAPKLVCEPGRAMVAEAFTLATRVKAINDEGDVFLNDGLYGALAELGDIENNDRISVVTPAGERVQGNKTARKIFGPTCDSLDVLPEGVQLPEDIKEGDYVLFDGMGAYSYALATGFNGYGKAETVTILGN